MTKTHEKLLVATLAGLIIAGAGLLMVQPALATATKPAPELYGASLSILTLKLSPPT